MRPNLKNGANGPARGSVDWKLYLYFNNIGVDFRGVQRRCGTALLVQCASLI